VGDARGRVLRNAAVQADTRIWERLLQLAKTAPTELERQKLYGLLGASQDDALAKRALGLVFAADTPATFGPVIVSSTSGRHPQMALDFAIANWDQLSKQLEVTSAGQ